MLDILGYAAFFLTTALTYALICLGLNIQWGMTGLFNVGVAGFVAIGAYVSALLTTPATAGRLGGFELPILVGWCAGAGIAGLSAALLGAITLRLRADYLAITTFGIAVSIQLVALNAQALTGGPFGIGFIPRPFASWADRPALFDGAHLLLTGAVLLAVFWAVERLARSPWGRVLRAIREDEAAAEASGIDLLRYKLAAVALSAALTAIGGTVLAFYDNNLYPDTIFATSRSVEIMISPIVGGLGSLMGPLIGAFMLTSLGEAMTALSSSFDIPGLKQWFYGAALLAIVTLKPSGLWPWMRDTLRLGGRKA